jgi:hypothetical protein
LCENKLGPSDSLRLDATRLCGDGDGQLPDLYQACSKVCRAKLDGRKKRSTKKMQALLRRIRSSILRTEIVVGDVVDIAADTTPCRFVEAGRGTVVSRHFNMATMQTDLVVKSLVGAKVQTVGTEGLRLVSVPRLPLGSPCVDTLELPAASGRDASKDASAAAAMASTRRRALDAEADASDLRRQRDEGRLREEDLRRRLEAAEFFGKGAAAENTRISAILKSVRLEALAAESRLERERNKNDTGTTRVEKRAFAKAHRQLSVAYDGMSTNNDAVARRLQKEARDWKEVAAAEQRRARGLDDQLAAIKDAARQAASVQPPGKLAAMDAPALKAEVMSQRRHIGVLRHTNEELSNIVAATEAAAKTSLRGYEAFLLFEPDAAAAAKEIEARTAVQMQIQYITVLEEKVKNLSSSLARLEKNNVPWLEGQVDELTEERDAANVAVVAAEAKVAGVERELVEAKGAAARLDRILDRLPRRRGRVFSPVDNELFFSIVAEVATAEACVNVLRIILLHVFGIDAAEGAFWEAPSPTTMKARTGQLYFIAESAVAVTVAAADKVTAGNDSTRLGTVDVASAWLAANGLVLPVMYVQPTATAVGTVQALTDKLARLNENASMVLAEVQKQGNRGAAAALADATRRDGIQVQVACLSKMVSTMQDGCATARASAELFSAQCLELRKQKYVDADYTTEQWDALPSNSPEKFFPNLICANHVRVLCPREYTAAEAVLDAVYIASLQQQPEPEEGPATTPRAAELGLTSVFRSLAKLFGAQRQVSAYAKGDNAKFYAVLEAELGGNIFADWGRGDRRRQWWKSERSGGLDPIRRCPPRGRGLVGGALLRGPCW